MSKTPGLSSAYSTQDPRTRRSSVYSVSSFCKILPKVRNRSLTNTQNIPKDQADRVTKNYILPMLRDMYRPHKTNLPSLCKTTRRLKSSSPSGQLTSSHKRIRSLCSTPTHQTNFMPLNSLLRKKLSTAKARISYTNKDRNSVAQNCKDLKHQIATTKTKLKLAKLQLFDLKFQKKLEYNSTKTQMLNLKNLQINLNQCKQSFSEQFSKANTLRGKITQERKLNAQYKKAATRLQYDSNLLRTSNLITGDSLKELYFSIKEILNSQQTLKLHFNQLKCSNLKNFQNYIVEALISTLEDKQVSEEQNFNSVKLIDNLKTKLKTLQNNFKYKIQTLTTQTTKNKELTEKYKSQFEKKESQVKLRKEELEKLKLKYNKHQRKKNINPEEEEKVCEVCQEYYTEKANLNWSCSFHTGSWNHTEKLWWCCGSQNPNSKGCVRSFHKSSQEKKPQEKELVCTSCNSTGHLAFQCAKDPGTRTGKNPAQKVKWTKESFETLGFEDIAKLKDRIEKHSQGNSKETFESLISKL